MNWFTVCKRTASQRNTERFFLSEERATIVCSCNQSVSIYQSWNRVWTWSNNIPWWSYLIFTFICLVLIISGFNFFIRARKDRKFILWTRSVKKWFNFFNSPWPQNSWRVQALVNIAGFNLPFVLKSLKISITWSFHNRSILIWLWYIWGCWIFQVGEQVLFNQKFFNTFFHTTEDFVPILKFNQCLCWLKANIIFSDKTVNI